MATIPERTHLRRNRPGKANPKEEQVARPAKGKAEGRRAWCAAGMAGSTERAAERDKDQELGD